MLSAYFRDIAHKRTMLELLQQRDEIQLDARKELQRRFQEFDIECVDVLVGKPDTAEAGGKIETLLEQLRQRQLSMEQVETYQRQRLAADEQKKLNEAQALAQRQTDLTGSKVQIEIARNQADADLERARKMAEQTVVTAEAESKQRMLAGQGEAAKIAEIGEAEAKVLMRKVSSYGDPRLYAMAILAEHLSKSAQPLVPQQVFIGGGGSSDSGASMGMLGTLINVLLAEKSGFKIAGNGDAGLDIKPLSVPTAPAAPVVASAPSAAAPTRKM
jgi:multidrug efflux pump subunit AcrA (membrane-fusion protein)